MEAPIPLGPEDRAILDIECQTIAGHTCKVVRLAPGAADAVDVERLRERVGERIELAPALTRRLGGSTRAPAWVADPSFDLAEHVAAAPVDGPVDHAGLLALVAELFEQRLPRERPLWRIDRVALADGGAALIWRIHHALADGTASVRYARALLWDESAEASMTPAQAHAAHAADERRRRMHLAGFLHREYAHGECRSPFDGHVGTRREIAFAVAPLRALHEAAQRLDGATVNDAVLTIVAGAIGHWVRLRHGELGAIRVRVPVSLHHEGDDAPNHDSFFSVALPLNEPDPVARLRTTHAATSERKADHDAQYREQLLRELSGVPPLERLLTRIESARRPLVLRLVRRPAARRRAARDGRGDRGRGARAARRGRRRRRVACPLRRGRVVAPGIARPASNVAMDRFNMSLDRPIGEL